eukprot:2485123-Rhodomonas_salina.3
MAWGGTDSLPEKSGDASIHSSPRRTSHARHDHAWEGQSRYGGAPGGLNSRGGARGPACRAPGSRAGTADAAAAPAPLRSTATTAATPRPPTQPAPPPALGHPTGNTHARSRSHDQARAQHTHRHAQPHRHTHTRARMRCKELSARVPASCAGPACPCRRRARGGRSAP